MKNSMFKIFLLWVISTSCQSPKLMIKAKDKVSRNSKLYLISIDGSNDTEKDLGKPPISINPKTLDNKGIKIIFADGSEKLLYFSSLISDKTTIMFTKPNHKDNLNSSHRSKEPSERFNAETRNQIHRLLLKAYQSLSAGNTQVTENLAKQVTKIDSQIAAPHILIGLCHLKKGNKNAARTAFENAKALDPLDAEIKDLIGLSR